MYDFTIDPPVKPLPLSGTKTGKATIPAAFNWYRKQLAIVGVATPAKFKSVLHTLQSATSASNIKALEAKREAERTAKGKTKPCSQFINYGHVKQTQNKTRKCGKICGMKKVTNAMFGAALSIFAVAAPCMASDGALFSAPHSAPFFPASNKLSTSRSRFHFIVAGKWFSSSLPPSLSGYSASGRDFHPFKQGGSVDKDIIVEVQDIGNCENADKSSADTLG